MTYNPRTIAWATPLVCLFIMGALLMWQNSNLSAANLELQNARSALNKATADRRAAEAAQSDTRFATANAGPAEELAFVDGLRRKVQLAGLKLKSMGASMATGQESAEDQAENAEKLKGIEEVAVNVTISGNYRSIRTFLRTVTSGDRLCNIEAIRWERKEDGSSEAAVTLTRYITRTGVVKA